MNKHILIGLVGAFLLGQTLSGQSLLSLEQALEQATANSPVAKQIQSTYQSNKWIYKAALGNRAPQIRFNADLPGYQRRINQVVQPDGSFQFIPVRQAYSNAGLSLSQVIPATGGSVSIESRINRGDIFDVDNSTFYQTNPLQINYFQPLFKFNNQKFNWKQDKLRLELANRQQVEQIEALNAEVISRYFDLYIAQLQLLNAVLNETMNDTIYRIAKGRFGVGKIAESELLQVELSYTNARNSVEQQTLQVELARRQLERFTGKLDNSIMLLAPLQLPVNVPDPEKSRQEALKNRSDLIANEININQVNRQLSEAKLSRLPQTDIVLSYGLNQTGSTIDQALAAPVNSQYAGLGFSIPIIGFGSNRSAQKAAQYAYEATLQSTAASLQQLETDAFGLALQVKQLKTSVEISSKADTIAKKRFEAARNRYKIGTMEITNLLIAQNEKDQAIISYVSTLRDFWVTWYQLRRTTLFDFEKNRALLYTEN
jgi:outer membrane protein TolC